MACNCTCNYKKPAGKKKPKGVRKVKVKKPKKGY